MSQDQHDGSGARAAKPVHYVLRLFVSGATQRSQSAILNLKAICERELGGCYELEVIDIYQQPDLAKKHQVVAVPMLMRRLPEPIRRVVGDLSREEGALAGLDLRPRKGDL